MTKAKIIEGLLNPGIVAVIRADNSGQLVECCEALAEGGVTAMEITMTTPNAIETIREVSTKLKGKVLLGVGTVLDAVTARLAILAGAEFVVTPITKADIVSLCLTYNKPIISGAFTPTEALAAHELGADFIKIFPADGLGPTYIKNILAPLPQLQIIPTGGVDVNTAGAFIKAGSVALGAGSSLVSKEILKNRDWPKLVENAKALVKAVADARAK
ncbi:2-dehydro-3-deoxyphosphogluconate aldolase [Verrucomicrobia bacterium LW23]|nr:2-dehydro-3-deoxyphosphogluconate aldolase [Verrucomicrobia bacterium LW23]